MCVVDCSGWFNVQKGATACEKCGVGKFSDATGVMKVLT